MALHQDRQLNQDLYGGVALVAAAAAALALVNSRFGREYLSLLGLTAEVRVGSLGVSKTIQLWINDGLMAIFFLLVTLEIKREAIEGALKSIAQSALPIIGAIGGFTVPPLIFAFFTIGDPRVLQGWAIPSATDIGFVIGIAAMLGARLPASLRLLLLTLAIVDDLLAIIVIALFYTNDLSIVSLLLAAAGAIILAILNRLDVRTPTPYVLVGVFTWVCVLKSGVHATLAGVMVGAAMPHTRHDSDSLLEHVEHTLKPYVRYGILPVFAFANAGVPLGGVSLATLKTPLVAGISAALFFGKQVGVFAFSAVALRLGWAKLPFGATLSQLYGTAILTGIGFTMSLFIGTLAFDDEAILDQVRLGVLLGSILSAVFGVLVLVASSAKRREDPSHSAVQSNM
jgi:Na+:H+ antiporter, NhaA family